jgi:site-specific DNA recombinase
MENKLEAFKQFAIKSKKPKDVNYHTNCVMYTRVSSSSQKDNTSLSSQKEGCRSKIKELGLNLIAAFGGNAESASGVEERKEYLKMFAFVSKKSNKVGAIIVYDYSRLSREGMKGYKDVEDLHSKFGVQIITVRQGIADYSPTGMFQQTIQFAYNKFENDLRREKCNQGSVNKMKQGFTVRRAPKGYDHTRINGEQLMEINDIGKAIKIAFKLKAQREYSNEKILQTLRNQNNVRLSPQSLSDIFKNPYYAGVLVDSRLDGEVVEGKHPKVVTMETFLLVNKIQSKNHKNYKQLKKNYKLPLRGTLFCDNCGKIMTGYHIKKKEKSYYKCNEKGCGMNLSAEKVHNSLINELHQFGVDKQHKEIFVAQLTKVFNHLNKDNKYQKKMTKLRIAELQKKIDKIEEKMLFADDKREQIFLKHIGKFEEQKVECERDLKNLNIQLSNLDKFINFSINISSNLNEIWGLSDWETKKQVASLVFPNGLTYNKQKESYRTFETNKIFDLIGSFSKDKEKGVVCKNQLSHEKSRLVAPRRLELRSIV